ncbi:MAG: hypothetical protein RhofKO_30020 [Rhodothermales bacterium]
MFSKHLHFDFKRHTIQGRETMKRLTQAAFGFALFVFAIAPLNVQAETAYTNSQWNKLEQQVLTALDSDVQAIQVSAMQHIAFFAANFDDEVDFRRSTNTLMRVYTEHSNEQVRILALQALNAVGGYQIMEKLADHVGDENSARVRKMTNAVLANYYHAA